MNTLNPAMEDAMTYTDKTDNSFPYVLVSSTLGALASLATVWVWTVATFGPVTGA